MNEAISTKVLGNRVEVLAIKDTWLDAERFDFTYFENRQELRLTKWMKLNKKTSRHKYVIQSIWDWYDRRNFGSALRVDSPPVPDAEIVEAAKQAIIEQFVSGMKINLDTSK